MIKEKRHSLKEHVRNNTDCIMIAPEIKSLRAWGKISLKLLATKSLKAVAYLGFFAEGCKNIKATIKNVRRVTILLLSLIFSSHKTFGV